MTLQWREEQGGDVFEISNDNQGWLGGKWHYACGYQGRIQDLKLGVAQTDWKYFENRGGGGGGGGVLYK